MSKHTKQGVPDLNGPRWNGASYNGHRTSCKHPPGLALTEVEPRLEGNSVVQGRVKRCGVCGADVTALHAEDPGTGN